MRYIFALILMSLFSGMVLAQPVARQFERFVKTTNNIITISESKDTVFLDYICNEREQYSNLRFVLKADSSFSTKVLEFDVTGNKYVVAPLDETEIFNWMDNQKFIYGGKEIEYTIDRGGHFFMRHNRILKLVVNKCDRDLRSENGLKLLFGNGYIGTKNEKAIAVIYIRFLQR